MMMTKLRAIMRGNTFFLVLLALVTAGCNSGQNAQDVVKERAAFVEAVCAALDAYTGPHRARAKELRQAFAQHVPHYDCVVGGGFDIDGWRYKAKSNCFTMNYFHLADEIVWIEIHIARDGETVSIQSVSENRDYFELDED